MESLANTRARVGALLSWCYSLLSTGANFDHLRASLTRIMNRKPTGTDHLEAVQIDGVVHGDIRANMIVIGKSAVVRGTIYADVAIIHGRVFGDIHARSVALHSVCHVEGQISQESIAIAYGAFFEGHCRYTCLHRADQSDNADVVAYFADTHRAVPSPRFFSPRVARAMPVYAEFNKQIDVEMDHRVFMSKPPA